MRPVVLDVALEIAISTAKVDRFFFNATPTTGIYTLSLHDALPIYREWCLALRTICARQLPDDRLRSEQPDTGCAVEILDRGCDCAHADARIRVQCHDVVACRHAE